jgi:hypothetical protein
MTTKPPGGRPVNDNRQIALQYGLKTYDGSPHSKCGTTERYVSGGGCVHCARVTATEQRDALKFLKQHAIDEAIAAKQAADGVDPASINDDFGIISTPFGTQGETFAEEPVNDDADNPDDPLDSADEDGLEIDDAEARRLAAIEDLM